MKPDITTKQMGDACEMLVVAELTLAGVPAVKMPDNWPDYDVIALPKNGGTRLNISVKSRTFKHGRDAYVEYNIKDKSFDWMAIVILPNDNGEPDKRRIFIFPKTISDDRFRHNGKPGTKYHDFMTVQVDKIAELLPEFEDNFCLSATGKNNVATET
jgi:hypothetical protein